MSPAVTRRFGLASFVHCDGAMSVSWSKTRQQSVLRELIDLGSFKRLRDRIQSSTSLPLRLGLLMGQPWPELCLLPGYCPLVVDNSGGGTLCYQKARAGGAPRTLGSRQYRCRGGLHHLMAPVTGSERPAPLLVLGPFLYHPPSQQDIIGQARRAGLDEMALTRAYGEIPVISDEKTAQLADLLENTSLLTSEYIELAERELQLRKQSEQLARQLSSVAEIASLVMHGDDIQGTFKELAGRICKAAGVNFSCIGKVEPQTNRIIFLAFHGVRLDKREWIGLPSFAVNECAFLEDAVKNSSCAVIDDPFINPWAHPSIRSFCKTHRLRKLVIVPVVSANTTWIIALGSRRARDLTQHDLSVISALCSQVAVAAKNTTTYAEQVEARRRATFLAEAGQLFNSTLDPNEVLQRVTEKITDVVGDCCAIALAGEGPEIREFKALHHREKRFRKFITRMIKMYPLHVGEGLIGKVMLAGTPILISNATENDFTYFDSPYAKVLQVRSALAVPIKIKGDTIGAIVVTESRPNRELGANDLELVATLAERASVAIDNAQLYTVAERERQKLAAVISGMTDGVIVCDGKGRVVSINKAGADIVVPVQEGTPLAKLYETIKATDIEGKPLNPDHFPLARVLETGLPVPSFEWLYHRHDGEKRTIQSSAAPIYDSDGHISGAVAVFRDITAAKQMDKLKDEFVSVVSHELRAPLATISGYTQMLIKQLPRRGEFKEELGQLELIRLCTHQLSTLVRDLLDISSFEAGSLSLNTRRVSLADLISTTVTRFERLSKNHRLVVHLSPALPPVLADPHRVEQILSNLISNAIKFSPDGGDVVVSTQPREGDVVISVKDRGIGISKYDRARLFNRFFRADNTENRAFEGIGLGLHVCKILVEAQGGQIWVESEKGRGSAFSFTLPFYGGGSDENPGC